MYKRRACEQSWFVIVQAPASWRRYSRRSRRNRNISSRFSRCIQTELRASRASSPRYLTSPSARTKLRFHSATELVLLVRLCLCCSILYYLLLLVLLRCCSDAKHSMTASAFQQYSRQKSLNRVHVIKYWTVTTVCAYSQILCQNPLGFMAFWDTRCTEFTQLTNSEDILRRRYCVYYVAT